MYFHRQAPRRQLTFAALSNVWGWRGGIRADSRKVNQPFDSGPACLNREALGRFDMNGVKGLPPALDVKADCIYDAVSAGKCGHD